MVPSNLSQRLVRDLRKNPRKTAVLALLAGVAAWFWAPLVLKQFRGPEKSRKTAAAAGSAAPEATRTEPDDAAPPFTRPQWQLLTEAVAADPRMQPSESASIDWPAVADPPNLEEEVAPQIDLPPEEPATTPQSAGLVLGATLVGSRPRVAVINGRPYREGNRVEMSDGTSFVLVEVGARHVVLSRGEERFVLQMAETEQRRGIVVVPQGR
jgi:hypothetical protein